jgi:hypothetical protein
MEQTSTRLLPTDSSKTAVYDNGDTDSNDTYYTLINS